MVDVDNVQILIGETAISRMRDAEFRKSYLALDDACPWGTVGQHPDFISTHWSIYQATHVPVLVFQEDAKGKLCGVLSLSSEGKKLGGVGADDYEYHVWLADLEHGVSFMPQALRALRRRMGARPLCLQYLPPGAPIGWAVDTGSDVIDWCELRAASRPILRLNNGEYVDRLLRDKRSLRKKTKNFQLLGRVSFGRVTEFEKFVPLLEQFIPMYDFRKGATHGVTAFRSNPRRRDLLLALFQVPNLLHVTSLDLGGQCVAAHIGLAGRAGNFTLGGFAHSEFFAKYSPGQMVIAELMRVAAAEGYRVLDLTPGEDGYKKLWARESETVYSLEVQPSAMQRKVGRAVLRAKASLQKLVERVVAPLALTPGKSNESLADRKLPL